MTFIMKFLPKDLYRKDSYFPENVLECAFYYLGWTLGSIKLRLQTSCRGA